MYEKVLVYIEIGKEEGKFIVGGVKVFGNGYYVEFIVFKDVDLKVWIM